MENEEEIEETQVETALRPVFSNDPEQAMQKAQTLITAISSRCVGKEFVAEIKSKKSNRVEKYPKVEWWTTVAAPLQLAPYIEPDSVRPIMKNSTIWGYEACAQVRDIRFNPPKIITRAEASCTRDEKRWREADIHAIKSMSQTRAVSKAFRIGLSWLAVMAGLKPTGAEEMPGYSNNGAKKTTRKTTAKTTAKKHPDLKKRIANWLDAEASGDPGDAKVLLSSLTNKLYTSLDQIKEPSHIKRLFEKCRKEIEAYENAGTPEEADHGY
ncbi:MAG: hypothetical protein JXI43_11665 [Tissierellales bacterium]|nr:hypothetical protein [Tissierellales bacterium]